MFRKVYPIVMTLLIVGLIVDLSYITYMGNKHTFSFALFLCIVSPVIIYHCFSLTKSK